jgi:hypothetical protein
MFGNYWPIASGPVPKRNRPDLRPRPRGAILFADVGATGWGRKRTLPNYKGNRSEKNFEHLHNRFTEEEV